MAQMIPEGWTTYKLNEITSKIGDGLHGTPIYDENGEYYFINGSNLVNGKIDLNPRTKKVNDKEFKKYKKELTDRTILLGINGTIGNVAYYNNEKCILGKSAAYLNVNENFDKRFLKYILLNDDFQKFIKTNATGTTIKNVGLALIREYEFKAPEAKEIQGNIASILSSLDDKIELNLQMNKTLEGIAQTIFKEWFVDFKFPGIDGELVDELPKGWRKGTLRDYCRIYRGASPRPITDPKYFKNGTIPWIKIADATSENSIYITKSKEFCTELAIMKSRFIRKGTLVMSNSATVGIPKILNIDGCVHDGWLVFDDYKLITRNYLFFILNNNLSRFISYADGSVQKNLNTEILKSLTFIVPEIDVISKFDLFSQIIFDKLLSNEIENQTLAMIRDTLLPKLMTGKIRVA
jgi:type I restriction enzyme S subunit